MPRLALAFVIFFGFAGEALADEEFWKDWRPTCSLPHFEQKYQRAMISLPLWS
jgi:hypothetical protein